MTSLFNFLRDVNAALRGKRCARCGRKVPLRKPLDVCTACYYSAVT